MSRATARADITAYLSGAGIAFLGTVVLHPPKFTNEAAFFANSVPGTASGAVIFVALRDQHEARIALGGPGSGKKCRYYKVTLLCFFRSTKPKAEDVGTDNDTFLDSLTAAIEANRTAGSAVIFQWGEGQELYGPDIKIETHLPRTIRQQMTQIFSTVDVMALEILTT